MEWINEGVYGDDNMPSIDTWRAIVMAQRISPIIDLSAAFDNIDEINSGIIGTFIQPTDSTDIEVYTSFDEGDNWDSLIDGLYIKNAEQLNDNPSITLKYIIKSYVSQIDKGKTPKLFTVNIILSDLKRGQWSTEQTIQLDWNGDN
ncbi:MAG: hypothetical protein ACLFPF_07115 [Halanaerobiales bacterium]